MKRRSISILLIVMLCLFMLPGGLSEAYAGTVIDQGVCGDLVSWTLDDEGLLTIKGNGRMDDLSGVNSTENYGPYHDQITDVVIQPGVTRIGTCAFFRQDSNHDYVTFSSMRSIQIPDTVESIGAIAFYYTDFEEITLPYGLKTLDNQAFEQAGFKTVVLPNSLTNAGYRTFSSSKKLESITISENLRGLSASMFAGCDKLSEVIAKGAFDTINDSAFWGCTSLEELELTVTGKDAIVQSDAFYNVPQGAVTIYGVPGGTVESEASSENYTFVTAQNTFTFDANGGTGEMDPISVTFDGEDKGRFPANTFTNGELLFNGWNTMADGTGIKVADQSEIKIFAANGPVTLYAQWDDSITVAGDDSSNANNYLPAYTYYKFGKSQYIIPAEEISGLKDQLIGSLRWYMAVHSFDCKVKVYLSETDETTLSGMVDVSGGTLVYDGGESRWTVENDNEILITFDEPYQYGGGNLLVTVLNMSGEYQSPPNQYYGEPRTGAGRTSYRDGQAYDASYNGSSNAVDFIPKTTLYKGDPIEPAIPYDVYVAGVQVTDKNKDDIAAAVTAAGGTASGSITYDPETNTLALDGAVIVAKGENTSYYGYGINYRGTDDFLITVDGSTIVQGYPFTFASYGILIGEPSPLTFVADAVANVTITVSEGSSLVATGGNINSNEDYAGTWGIYNKTGGSLAFKGSGTVQVTAGAESSNRKVYGIVASYLVIDESVMVNSIAGNGNLSVAIMAMNFTLPESFNGTVYAKSGNAPGTYYSAATYAIRTVGNISINGGTVMAETGKMTATSGTSADYAAALFGENSLSISNGAVVMAKGDGFGLYCYQSTVSIDASSVTAIGNNMATNGLNLTNVTAIASSQTDGSNPVEYNNNQYTGYKYVKTKPAVQLEIVRIAGKSRYLTAFAAADKLKEEMNADKFPNMVIASGTGFADALSGAYLAVQKSAPVLLTHETVMADVAEYVKNNMSEGGQVFILGGNGAVPNTMEEALEVQGITNVTRLKGKTRYDTNIAILEEAGVSGKDLLVCSGSGYADSLSASAVGQPILLVGDSLTDNQKAYLESVKESISGDCYAIGGSKAVSDNVLAEVHTYATGTAERVFGKSRFGTSTAIAQKFFPSDIDTVVLAYGMNYPDGLAGGPVAYFAEAPMLLVTNDSYDAARDYVQGTSAKKVMIMGGEKLISNETARAIFE